MEPSPIGRLFSSSKALIMLATMAGAFALVWMGKITWDQAEKFLSVTVPAWMVAVGIEDAAKHMSGSKAESVAKMVDDAVKKSLPPPPPKQD